MLKVTGARILLPLAWLVTACGSASTPSADSIGTQVAQAVQATQSAASPTPAATVTPAATRTAIPTDTPEPTVTPKPTDTQEPSPTPDFRVIVGDAEDYILTRADIPDRYTLGSGNSTPHLNSEILSARGVIDGKAYLEATGRIKGWIIWYHRAADTVIAPEWIESYVVMYKTAHGAALAMGPDWNNDFYDDVKSGKIEQFSSLADLGDANLVYRTRTRQSSGAYLVGYTIEFRYRNVWTEVYGEGGDNDIRPEALEQLARTVLERLKAAPLADAIP